MAFLKIYQWEWDTYPEFQKVMMANSDAERYFKKFARHFKVSQPRLSRKMRNGTNSGTYYSGHETIRLARTVSLGTVIHEFAHHLADRTNSQRNKHNKQFKKSLKKVYTFAKRYIHE